MLQVLRPYHVAFERIAIAVIFTFIVADLYPHPSLSPGLIMSTVSHIQAAAELGETDVLEMP